MAGSGTNTIIIDLHTTAKLHIRRDFKLFKLSDICSIVFPGTYTDAKLDLVTSCMFSWITFTVFKKLSHERDRIGDDGQVSRKSPYLVGQRVMIDQGESHGQHTEYCVRTSDPAYYRSTYRQSAHSL